MIKRQVRTLQRILIPVTLVYTGLVLALLPTYFYQFRTPTAGPLLELGALLLSLGGLLWGFVDTIEQRIATRISNNSNAENIGLSSVIPLQPLEINELAEKLTSASEVSFVIDANRPIKPLLYLIDNLLDSPRRARIRLLLTTRVEAESHNQAQDYAIHGMLNRLPTVAQAEARVTPTSTSQVSILIPSEAFVYLGGERSRSMGVLLGFRVGSPIGAGLSEAFEELWARATVPIGEPADE